MGEGGTVFQEHMPEANVNANVEKKSDVDAKIEVLTGKNGEEDKGLKKMEVENESNVELETQKIDGDEEGIDEHKVTDKTVVAEKAIEEGTEESIAEKVERSTEEMEEDTEDKVEDEIDGVKEKVEKTKEPNKGKGSRTRARSNSSDRKKHKRNGINTEDKTKKETTTSTEINRKGHKTSEDKNEVEPKTPAESTIERPVRERKSVERLLTTILKEKDSARDFHVEKGRGTALKDIPNVAYKLSRKKNDDTFKLLHTVLFNRRGKAAEVKNNISRFSGFVWHDNEEKQMNKVKEKLDKCVKDKLVEFCDVLDIPVSRANTRKEDIIAKLIEFLVAPHATTSELLAENDQSSKGKKRKRVSKSASGNSKASKGSSKGLKKTGGASKTDGETKSLMPESEVQLGEGREEELKEGDANEIPEGSGDDMSLHETEEKEIGTEDQSDENKGKQKQGSEKSSTKKGSPGKATSKKKATLKTASSPKKARNDMFEQAETEEKEIETEEAGDENKVKQMQGSTKTHAKKGSAVKATTKRKAVSETASPPSKKAAPRSPPSRVKNNNDTDVAKKSSGIKKDAAAKQTSGKNKDESPTAKETSSKKDESTTAKKSSRRKKDELTTGKEHSGDKKDELIKNSPAPRKSASKESTGAKVMKVKNKLKVEKSNPNDDELRCTIVKILKEVDFNTATFTDILKMLTKKYKTDFTPRKSAIKIMIQDELTKLADADEGDGKEDKDDAGINSKQPSTQDVKA